MITCLGKIARAKLSMPGGRSYRERQCSSTENRRLASPQIMLSSARATRLLRMPSSANAASMIARCSGSILAFGCALRGVSLQARPARWTARRWHASAAAAIHGFADGASQPPDVLCIQDRKAELIGIFDAYIHPRRTARPAPVRSH
jgi:hypothetical protein